MLRFTLCDRTSTETLPETTRISVLVGADGAYQYQDVMRPMHAAPVWLREGGASS